MNPYEVLGVDKDADLVDIRYAYKVRAQKLHPDREGGSHEKFTELQAAYKVLKNQKSREHYDRFGEVGADEVSLEQEAISAIMGVFAQWIGAVMAGNRSEGSDCIQDIKSQIHDVISQMTNELVKINKHLSKIDRMLGTFTVDDDDTPNIFEGHLQAMKLGTEKQRGALNKKMDVSREALNLLKHFTYTPEGGFVPAAPRIHRTMHQAYTTSTGGM